MQNVQPDNMNSMPLRQSSHSVGTIVIRFVGLLTLAVVAMTLIWSRSHAARNVETTKTLPRSMVIVSGTP